MVLLRLKSLAPACALALSSQLLLGATSFSDNFTARILSAHNRERLALGVPAKLRLDEVDPAHIAAAMESYVARGPRYRDELRRLD